jgi:branched-chain amino acid transport system permease protein
MLQTFLDALVAGVAVGSVYALIAFGYNLIFATTGILNLAQGQILGLGIMLSYGLHVTLGWNALAALVAVVAVGAALGAVEETATVRFLRGRVREDGWLVTTLGAALIIQAGVLMYWGGTEQRYPPLVDRAGLQIGDVAVRPQTMIALGVAVALTAAFYAVNRYTKAGWALQAIAEDREAASLRGINVSRASWATFAAGAGISALAGWVIAPITFATTSLGFVLGLKGFVAMLLGGQGSPAGALAGGLILGIAEEMGKHFGPTGLGDLYGFILFSITLNFLPNGVFGGIAVRRA